MKRSLTRMVQWSQDLLAEVVQSGDLVVDLTVGTGQDTLALLQMVGEQGQVVGFDIQSQALLTTREKIVAVGARVRLHQQNVQPLQHEAGVDLLQMNHVELSAIIPAPVKGIIANLGYLPGGSRDIITRPETTVSALEQGCSLLVKGGRMAVVVYPGHLGGAEEGAAIGELFAGLQDPGFQVLRLSVSNRPAAPFVFLVEKS